jgi:hypothetical protein
MTVAQKQALEAFCEAGNLVSEVVYDPSTVVGDPEASALAAGWTQYLRQATADLVEVIYTMPALSGTWVGKVLTNVEEPPATTTVQSGTNVTQ